MISREDNAGLNALEFRERRLVLDSSPTMLYVELTQNCNLHCKMCRSAGRYDPSRDMSPDIFDRVVSQLMPTATMVDLRGWGESTILNWFPSAVARTASSGARVRLVTNGIAMTPELWRAIWETDGAVAVSVDAASPELARILGRGDVVRVVENVREGMRLRQEVGLGSLYFNTIVSAENIHELSSIIALAHSVGVMKVVLNPVKADSGDPLHLSKAAAVLPGALSACAAVAAELGVTVHLGAALSETSVVGSALPETCSNPWSHVVVAFNGDVLFCDHLIGQPRYSVGNLNRQTFRDIWNGFPLVSARAAHVRAAETRDVGCLQKCTWCYLNRYGESESAPLLAEARRIVPIPAVLDRPDATGH